MSDEQLIAFELASGVQASDVLFAIAAVVLLLAFIWSLWITLGTFRAWHDSGATLFDLAWSVLRASIVLMVLGFYLR